MHTLSFKSSLSVQELKAVVDVLRRETRIRGWIRDRVQFREGCLQFMRRYAQQLSSRLPDAAFLDEPYDDPYLFKNFMVLPSKPCGVMEIAGRSICIGDDAAFCHFDDPDSRGLLAGRLVYMGDVSRPVVAVISIDGQEVRRVTASEFRRELLEGGHPTGLGGFAIQVPREFLDGQGHEISVRPELDCELVGRHTGSVHLPFHYRGERPWMGGEDALATARHEVMRGDLQRGLDALQTIIDEQPAAIFTDFGFIERARESDRAVPTFPELLRERAALWHSSKPCGSENCCKQRGLNLRRFYEFAGDHFGTTEPCVVRRNCRHWPKFFASKLFIKEYAAQFNVATPKTLTSFNCLEDISRSDLPVRCVIKPEASSGVGLYLLHGDLNLFDGCVVSWQKIQEEARRCRDEGQKVVVEEFLVQEGCAPDDPVIPLDYKMHAYGGKVRLIHIDDRNHLSRDRLRRLQGWFARDWTPAPLRFRDAEVEYYGFREPASLPLMLELGDRIAADIGDYVRIDFYATADGPCLGEVTTTTHNGIGFTAFGNMVLRQLWDIYPGPMASAEPVWK